MDPCLTQQIPISMPVWRKYSDIPKIPGYKDITSITPIVEKFFNKTIDFEGQIQSDEMFRSVSNFGGGGSCLVETTSKKKRQAYCKVTHILDPVRTIQGYYSNEEKGVKRVDKKIGNPNNQAYVDGLASYLLGQLRERKISPHFCLFYGTFKGVADTYRYNITDEFESYRNYKTFWERKKDGVFSLYIDGEHSGDMDDHWLLQTPSSVRSSSFTYSTPRSSSSEDSHISLDGEDACVELESLKSASSFESASTKSESSSEESQEGISVYIQLKEYPVVVIFQEEMTGVLDSMLEDDTLVGEKSGTPEWEDRWIAWTFQIIAALCAAQGVLGLTHNDLHTNNIVWKETSESWLWYKLRDGTLFRVPTYGKIFYLIDFGRAIFRVHNTWFISDDYEPGGDADGQYNFDRIKIDRRPEVFPNPSFDLCRYAVSIIEALYPEDPERKKNGALLSKEGRWEIYETKSAFWNLLWSWLVDESGNNVLREEDGSERFPDFDLYQHISQHVKSCRPQDQVRKEIFSKFIVNAKDVGDWESVYPLFC